VVVAVLLEHDGLAPEANCLGVRKGTIGDETFRILLLFEEAPDGVERHDWIHGNGVRSDLLEDDLGVRLLERGPNGLALTPAGTQLLAEATPALTTLSQAEQRLYDSSGVAGMLRVSIPPHFEPKKPVFSEFCRRYPVVRVGEGGYSSYVGRTLARYRHRVVSAPSLLRGAEVPPFMARDPLDDGRLVEILPDYPMPLQTIRALVVDTRALSPLVRQFLEFAANAVPHALGGVADDRVE